MQVVKLSILEPACLTKLLMDGVSNSLLWREAGGWTGAGEFCLITDRLQASSRLIHWTIYSYSKSASDVSLPSRGGYPNKHPPLLQAKT